MRPEVAKPSDCRGDEFAQVFWEELRQVEMRRSHVAGTPVTLLGTPDPPDDAASQPLHELYATVREAARDDSNDGAARRGGLVGLACSGGGIRSATLNLGFLQALAQSELLDRFDYLSTVSGGGYIGGWLAAWIYREGDLKNVERQLKPGRVDESRAKRLLNKDLHLAVDEEPEPIYHLRAFSSYLSPKLGIMSADSWTLISIYLRNLLLNALFWVPALLSVVLSTRVAYCVFTMRAERAISIFGVPLDPKVLASVGISVDQKTASFAGVSIDQRFLSLVGISVERKPGFVAGASAEQGILLIGGISIGLLLFGLTMLALLVFWRFNRPFELRHGGPQSPGRIWMLHLLGLVPLGCAALIGAWLFAPGRLQGSAWFDNPLIDRARDLSAFAPSVVMAAMFGLLCLIPRPLATLVGPLFINSEDGAQPATEQQIRWYVLAASRFACGFLFGLEAYLLVLLCNWIGPGHARLAFVFVPPALILALLAAIAFQIGLLGQRMVEDEREWWASVAAHLLIYSAAWVAVTGTIIYGPILVLSPDARSAVAKAIWWFIAWLATGIAGTLAGKSRQPRLVGQATLSFRIIASVAPAVFLFGLVVLAAIVASYLVALDGVPQNQQTYKDLLGQASMLERTTGLLGATLVLTLVLSTLINVNLFSLHALYANRLIRCFLGASRAKTRWVHRDWTPLNQGRNIWKPEIEDWGPGRGGAPTGVANVEAAPAIGTHAENQPAGVVNLENVRSIRARAENQLTGFDAADDIPLCALRPGAINSDNDKEYQGPLLILNTALNLVGGDELAWQERKAESFILSPTYCGSRSTSYRRTDNAALKLGQAMAISGAAVSPNMGAHSSTPLTALMTLFNVRLGWWLENPNTSRPTWTARSPRHFWRLLDELRGRTDERGEFVYLSDGGHFDNLGAYELVRRHCRYIVVFDGSADGDYKFEDLASLIRKVRIDFGIRIDIDTTALRPSEPLSRSRWHCAVGSIHYEDVDPLDTPGVLVYAKASLTGDEPTDVLEYGSTCSSFPHETTVDQFFTESQFESYRALGYHIGSEVFRSAVTDGQSNDALFGKIRSRWVSPPPGLEQSFLETTRQFQQLHARLQADPLLGRLVEELFDELPAVNQAAPPEPREADSLDHNGRSQFQAEISMVAQMLHTMEAAWRRMRFDSDWQHPLNQGWMNLFRRWTNSNVFNRHWAALKGQLSKEFAEFCARELKLVVYDIFAEPIGGRRRPGRRIRQALRELRNEFNFEWYEERNAHRGLKRRIKCALRDGDAQRMCWIIWTDPAGSSGRKSQYPVGIVLIAKPIHLDETLPKRSEDFTYWEQVVWVRGAYRNLKIAGDCLSAAVDRRGRSLGREAGRDDVSLQQHICRQLRRKANGSSATLFVRYPRNPQTGNYERTAWQNFFYRFGFRRPYHNPAGLDTILEFPIRSH